MVTCHVINTLEEVSLLRSSAGPGRRDETSGKNADTHRVLSITNMLHINGSDESKGGNAMM